MATQTLEFSAGTGLTLSCKLFALGSDTVVATASASEKANDKNRYAVVFADIPAGAYRLNAYVGATGGFANEVYDLTLTQATFYPRTEAAVSQGISGLDTKLNTVIQDTSTDIPNLITQVINVTSIEVY